MDQSGESIRVLHVDDEPELCEAVSAHLERHDLMTVVTEKRARDGLARLETEPIDCIVSDHGMPAMNGLEFLREVRSEYPDLPFVLFTGKGNEEIASEAISAGVTEYLQKDDGTEQYTVLSNRVERAVSEVRARKALERQEDRYSTLISNLPGMVYRCRNEPGWPMTFVSEGAVDLTEYDPTAIESGDVVWERDVIVEEDRERVWNEVQTALDSNEPFEVTYRITGRDGQTRWVWERGEMVTKTDDTEVLEGFITDITVRKERERKLTEERDFTEKVLNSLDDLFYVIDTEGSLLRWNRQVETVSGYDSTVIASMNALEFFPEEERERARSEMKRAIDTGSTDFEAHVETKDGELIPVEFRGTTLSNADGELVGISGVGRDITERRAREQELRQYKTLTESVADPMYVMNSDGTIGMCNEALARHLGYDRDEIVGNSPNEFIVDDGVERAESHIEEMLTSDRETATIEMETVDASGQISHNETKIAVINDADGHLDATVGVIRDITDRKKRERELQRYETIIQAVGDPVYTLDEDGVFTVVNDAVQELSGYDRDELVGEHISKIMTEADVRNGEQLIAELLTDDERANGTFEMDVVTADGTNIPCENHVALLPTDDGEFRGTAGVIRNISDRKQRERQLEQFASVVSHDLRSPLNVVQGRVEHVLSSGDVSHLEDVADAAGRMERLIEDLLTLAHEGQRVGEPEPVALDVASEAAWDHLQVDAATLVVETDRVVEADFDRLRELFENLFCNAIVHGGPDVTIRVVETDDGFAVTDDGSGIPADERGNVFERGFTTSEEGTGFGLAIVDTIVQAHDWSISAGESDEGGARFDVRI